MIAEEKQEMGVRMRNLILAGTIAASLAVTACSPAEDAAGEAARAAEAEPSEADRRAAALLSLSNNSTLEGKKDPYELAVACLVALDSLQERMAEVQALDDEKRNALRLARTLYERRATAASGKPAAELASDVEAGRAAADDPSLQAQTAVSCLRKLT